MYNSMDKVLRTSEIEGINDDTSSEDEIETMQRRGAITLPDSKIKTNYGYKNMKTIIEHEVEEEYTSPEQLRLTDVGNKNHLNLHVQTSSISGVGCVGMMEILSPREIESGKEKLKK